MNYSMRNCSLASKPIEARQNRAPGLHEGEHRPLQHLAAHKPERPLDHFAHIDRGMVDGAGLLHLVGDDLVPLVEEQDAKLGQALELPKRASPTV